MRITRHGYIKRHVYQVAPEANGRTDTVILVPRIKIRYLRAANGKDRFETAVVLPNFLLPHTRYTPKSFAIACPGCVDSDLKKQQFITEDYLQDLWRELIEYEPQDQDKVGDVKDSDQVDGAKSPDQANDAKGSDQAGDTKSSDQANDAKGPDQAGDAKGSDQTGDTKSPDGVSSAKSQGKARRVGRKIIEYLSSRIEKALERFLLLLERGGFADHCPRGGKLETRGRLMKRAAGFYLCRPPSGSGIPLSPWFYLSPISIR